MGTDRADAGQRDYFNRKNRNQSFGEGTPRPADSKTSKSKDLNPGGADMNTVSRGAGRPAATARKNRHAQTTPLPPKAGSAGAQAIADAKAAKTGEADRYGSMLVADLREVAKGLGVEGYSRMPKGSLLIAIREMEAAKVKIATDGRDRAAEAFAVAEKSKSAASRAAESIGEATPVEPSKIDARRQTDLKKMGEAAPKTKSWQKALAFRDAVAALGWSTSCGFVPDGEPEDIVEVTATRGNEHLWISWTAGAMTLVPMPSYTIDDRTIKLKNASACLKYAGRDVKTAHDELSKVTSNKAFRRKAAAPKKAKIPFDTGTATDAEVIDALIGKTVEWYNSISGAMESGSLGRDAHRITIQVLDGGDRIVKFCCPSTGFRAFRLSALTRVGGGAKITVRTSAGRIEQERLAEN